MRLIQILENGSELTQNLDLSHSTNNNAAGGTSHTSSDHEAISQILAARDKYQNSRTSEDRLQTAESAITVLSRELQNYKSEVNAGLRTIAQNFQKTNSYIEQLARINGTELHDEEDDPNSWVDL